MRRYISNTHEGTSSHLVEVANSPKYLREDNKCALKYLLQGPPFKGVVMRMTDFWNAACSRDASKKWLEHTKGLIGDAGGRWMPDADGKGCYVADNRHVLKKLLESNSEGSLETGDQFVWFPRIDGLSFSIGAVIETLTILRLFENARLSKLSRPTSTHNSISREKHAAKISGVGKQKRGTLGNRDSISAKALKKLQQQSKSVFKAQ